MPNSKKPKIVTSSLSFYFTTAIYTAFPTVEAALLLLYKAQKSRGNTVCAINAKLALFSLIFDHAEVYSSQPNSVVDMSVYVFAL